MKIIDVNEKRKHTVERFEVVDWDKPYIFYYDETNNLKKFHVKESEFNYSHSGNFVLGGFVFEKSPPDLTELFLNLNLQKSVTDVKLRHIAKGDFLECLTSEKLNYFLKYIFEKEILIHFTWVNLLYWSVADIVDSAILCSSPHLIFDNRFMNNVRSNFYKVVKIEINAVIKLFYKFQYPNIKKDEVIPFIEELVTLYKGHIHNEEYKFGLKVLSDALQHSIKKQTLPFLRNEKDHMLLQDFNDFYLDPICLFKNATHVFDDEQSVSELLHNTKIMNQGSELKSYSFVKSHESQIIQACDILVGILGKFSSYLNTSSENDVKADMKRLSSTQQQNLDLIIDLMDRSVLANPAFIISYDSYEEKDKMGFIYQARNKKVLGPVE